MNQKPMVFGALSVLISGILWMPASAGGVEKICAGLFTDMRHIGVLLGDCDLNSVSEVDFKRITDDCGEPENANDDITVDTLCRVYAIVSPQPEQHEYGDPVFIVRKVLRVEKP